MSTARIPFSLSVIWAIHVTMTAPQPPPRVEERTGPVGWEVSIMPLCLKMCCWTAGIAEIMVIIANAYPVDAWSTYVTTFLVNSQSEPSNIRLTWGFILGSWMSSLLFANCSFQKACFCLAGFGEALLTFASIYPSSPWSKSIAAFLIDSHPVSLNIRLTWSFIAAWIFAIAGAIIRRRCYQVMGEMFTFELSLRNHHKLVTWGPYAVVRHPSYTGVAMALIGGSICYSTPGSWTFENSHSPWARFILILCWVVTTVAGIFVVRRANTEDKMLQKQFGTEWESWAKKVPCRLIPGVY
ncbi:hypothetical protein CVT25_015716 [Psilocybe cyanescens]|uniref:Protein-S-isoprenylcysteine O-methyltransferase n=1 Tax=Psilocybe cyanescens TaxID=93625 RepID=A0A409X1P1_PSICY|nr:hypothetical protein CVT25_015716 [Psilocybe cyanescens]